MNKSKRLRGLVCGVAGGTLWGFSGCCGEFLFSNYNVSSGWLTAARLLGAGVLLIVLSLFVQRKNLVGAVKCPKDLVHILCYGIFGLLFCQLSYLTAIKHSSAATATVIQYVGPVLVMLVVCIHGRRLPRKAEVLSIILALGGTFLVATHGNIHTLQMTVKGLLWNIACAVSVVSYTLIPGKITEKRSSMVVNGCGMLAGGIVLGLAFKVWLFPTLDTAGYLALAGIIVLGTAGAFTLYMQAVNDIGPIKASIIACTEPLSAAVISFFWLGKRFAHMDIVGMVLILSTVFLLSVKQKNKKTQ